MADVSGAHLNPAVSIGLLVGKRISIERFLIYIVAQVIHQLSACAGMFVEPCLVLAAMVGRNKLPFSGTPHLHDPLPSSKPTAHVVIC